MLRARIKPKDNLIRAEHSCRPPGWVLILFYCTSLDMIIHIDQTWFQWPNHMIKHVRVSLFTFKAYFIERQYREIFGGVSNRNYHKELIICIYWTKVVVSVNCIAIYMRMLCAIYNNISWLCVYVSSHI